MSPGRRAATLAASLILGILVVPAAAATDGHVTADAVRLQAARTEGASSFFWFENENPQRSLDLAFELDATSVVGTLFERHAYAGPTTPGIDPVQPFTPSVPVSSEDTAEPFRADAAAFSLERTQGEYEMVVRTGASQGFAWRAQSGGFQAEPIGDAYWQQGETATEVGIREGSAEEDSADASTFRRVNLPGPNVVARGFGLGFDLTITGDFTLEFKGVDVVMDAGGEPMLIRGSTWSERVTDEQPSGTEPVVRREVTGFVRMHLQGATLRLSNPFIDGPVQWLMPEGHAAPVGPATLVGAEGTLETSRGQRIGLSGETYELAGGTPLLVSPRSADRLDVAVGEDAVASATPSGGDAPSAVPGWAVPWAVLITVAAFLIASLVWAIRHFRVPDMSSVEKAIEAGRYQRAADMAGRLLARQPGSEEAAVARAVALSKAGQHGRVIREVEQHLDQRGSSDGVLHYLVGVSYLKRGRTSAARLRFKEAVRRTPALQTDVARHLPASSSIPNGYA